MWGSGGIAPHFLNLRSRRSASCRDRFIPSENKTLSQSRYGSCGEMDHDPVPSPQWSLYQLSHTDSYYHKRISLNVNYEYIQKSFSDITEQRFVTRHFNLHVPYVMRALICDPWQPSIIARRKLGTEISPEKSKTKAFLLGQDPV